MACLVGCGGPGADNLAQTLANNLHGHTVWGADVRINDDDVTISHCVPNSTDTFLDITYEATSAAVKIYRFTYIPAFRAELIRWEGDIGKVLRLAAEGQGTVQIGNNVPINVPFPPTSPIDELDDDDDDDYITLTIGETSMKVQLFRGMQTTLTIIGDISIVSSTLFRECLYEVTDCGNRRLPEKCFEGCSKLEKMPKTLYRDVLPPNLTSFFAGCTSLYSTTTNWDVGAVTDMTEMFRDCENLELVGAHWDTGRVTSMAGMFYGCRDFKDYTLNQWDVSHVQDMSSMFRGCTHFNQPLDRWNVSNVTLMTAMFQDCKTFNQSINTWNVSAVESMADMFTTTTYAQPLYRWTTNPNSEQQQIKK